MRPEEFAFARDLLKARSGLVLHEGKAYLLESRLMPIARKLGFGGVEEFIQHVRLNQSEDHIVQLVEAMTTNESFFFRDGKPFDLFRDHVLPQLLAARADKKSFRIWCAAAASGQEPYSLAMLLKDQGAKLDGWDYEILGTDISRDILAKAERGVYSQFEVQRGLSISLLVKHFTQDGDAWTINPDIRENVRLSYFNLLDDPAPLGEFDVVFCRNVLIYFDQETKGQVLGRIAKLMAKDGMLFLGGVETVLGVSEAFKPIQGQRGVYGLT